MVVASESTSLYNASCSYRSIKRSAQVTHRSAPCHM